MNEPKKYAKEVFAKEYEEIRQTLHGKEDDGECKANDKPIQPALICILEILQKETDENHLITQEEVTRHLKDDYGISAERKTVKRDVEKLISAGYDIECTRKGMYILNRSFEDSEIRLLMDGVIASKHISPKQTEDLLDRLKNLATPTFRHADQGKHTVREWDKSDNASLFYNIDVVNEAIDKGVQVEFNYNKYGADKKLAVTSHHCVSPYQLILHNQRYYLMSLNEKYKNISYLRLDHITQIKVLKKGRRVVPATDIRTVRGFENGIDCKRFSTMPYMYADAHEVVQFKADKGVLDGVIDWFGKDIKIEPTDNSEKFLVTVTTSPSAMEYWAIQYCTGVEITSPESLRNKVRYRLQSALEKYQ